MTEPVLKQGFPGGSDGKESACNKGDLGSLPGSERTPGEGNGTPLQYSCLDNSIGQGARRAAVSACILSHFSRVRLSLTLWTVAFQALLSMEFSRQILEWVAMPSSRVSSRPRDQTFISCLLHWQASSLPLVPPGKPSLQSMGSERIGHDWATDMTEQLTLSLQYLRTGISNPKVLYSFYYITLMEQKHYWIIVKVHIIPTCPFSLPMVCSCLSIGTNGQDTNILKQLSRSVCLYLSIQ